MEAGGDDAADDALAGLLDAHHEDHLGDEEAQHQVLVDRVAVTLQVTATDTHNMHYEYIN